MKTYEFNIPIYKIDVLLVQAEKDDKYADIKKALGFCNVQDNEIKEIYNEIKDGCTGGGYTYRNFDVRKIMCIFYPMKDKREMEEVYSHEKRHIKDRILQHAGVDDIESAGLLAGFLGEHFYEFKQIGVTKKILKEDI